MEIWMMGNRDVLRDRVARDTIYTAGPSAKLRRKNPQPHRLFDSRQRGGAPVEQRGVIHITERRLPDGRHFGFLRPVPFPEVKTPLPLCGQCVVVGPVKNTTVITALDFTASGPSPIPTAS